jgi:integrase
MKEISIKFQPGVKGKNGTMINISITGLANLSTSKTTTRYVTSTGVILKELEQIETNQQLNDIKSNIFKAYDKASINETLHEFTRDTIKTIIAKVTQRDAAKLKKLISNEKEFTAKDGVLKFYAIPDNFDSCIDLYINTHGGYLIQVNSNKVKQGTLKGFKSLKMHINALFGSLKLSNVNQTTLNKFEAYFEKDGKAASSHAKYLSYFKRVLQFATLPKVNLSDNRYFEQIGAYNGKVLKVQTENIFSLPLNDIKTIYEYKAVDKAEIAKDIFVFLCMTGLRVSDTKNLTISTLEGIEQLSFVIQKTNLIGRLPLNKTAREILTKYDNKLPRIADQEINRIIKKIGLALGWDGIVPQFELNVNDQNIKQTTCLKYELLSTKIGRKSFATLMSKNGYMAEASQIMGYEAKGIFKSHYAGKIEMPKLLEAVKTLEIK